MEYNRKMNTKRLKYDGRKERERQREKNMSASRSFHNLGGDYEKLVKNTAHSSITVSSKDET